MNNWGANHGAISYGHIGADLITLASLLRIPVTMHNVPEERIFRPSAWSAFGAPGPGRGRLPRLRQLWPALRQSLNRGISITTALVLKPGRPAMKMPAATGDCGLTRRANHEMRL